MDIHHQPIIADCLREFFREFKASLDPRVWYRLVQEEHGELLEALAGENKVNILKEMMDLMYVQIGFNLSVAGAEQFELIHPEEQEAMMTTLVAAGETYEKAVGIMGNINYLDAFRRVHNSNLSKLGDDGLPIFDDDGKIMKGPNYKAPKLEDLI